ncbi:MAG: VanW family protein [Bradymonadales bacterium]|jgi:vancomycin resistance protein YoaR
MAAWAAIRSVEPRLYPSKVASFEASSSLVKPLLAALQKQASLDTLPAQTQRMRLRSPYIERDYSLAELGVVQIATDDNDALRRAILDGAQKIDYSSHKDLQSFFYAERFRSFLDDMQDRIDRPKAEGRWDFDTAQAISGIDGLKLKRQETQAAFLAALMRGDTEFGLVVQVDASLSKADPSLVDFNPKILIGKFTTTFSRSKNRTINVKLAASALNGVLLVPHADFSYNELVGERSEERGYREAPVIEQGQMVEGLGGGACQVSSTVHAAALFGGLEIVERHNHSLPSSYIGLGLDAVVAYPLLDLRVRNNSERPVVLRVYTEEDRLIAEFLSDKEAPRSIFRKEVIETIAYKEVLSFDPELPEGEFKITKRGRVGYKVSKGRIRWLDGKEEFEKMKLDIYQPQVQHVSVGPNTPYPPIQEAE